MKQPNLDKVVATRVTAHIHKKFHAKAGRLGRPSDVLREMIEAFIDERLTVTPKQPKRK